jgi:hypothetical protein
MKLTGLYLLSALAAGVTIGAGYTHISSVSASPDIVCRGSARAMGRLEMLFGTSRAQGGAVTEEEWSAFLDTEVTPRFPAGLTVLNGPGQWRGSDGKLTKEQSKILVIWHEPSTRTEADIEAIRAAYMARFDQESVMRVDSLSCVSF